MVEPREEARTEREVPGPPAHEDLIETQFHRRGKLNLWTIKDARFGELIRYIIDSHMQSRLALNALSQAVIVRRGSDAHRRIVHSDKPSQSRFARSHRR